MTLIVTQIDQFGILHVSDSNITTPENKVMEEKKVFEIPYLNSGLSISGSYGIGNTSMDKWMPNFINSQNVCDISLKQFSNNLRDSLQNTMSSDQMKEGNMVHVAGFVKEGDFVHPEFWFIRNVHKIKEENGDYDEIDNKFEISEDYWSKDSKSPDFVAAVKNPNVYVVQKYFNGFPAGRIGYMTLSKELGNFFRNLWATSGLKFRPPQSLEERVLLIECYMKVIDTMFKLSNHNAPYVGGATQVFEIKAPVNLILCE